MIILAFTTRFLPIAYTCSAAGLQSINPEMEEAVRILGGGRLTAIRSVVAPLLKKSLAGGWILVFIPATRELSTAIFLTGPHTQVISVVLFDLSSEGNFEVLSALSDVLLIATIVVVAIGFRAVGTGLHVAQEQLGDQAGIARDSRRRFGEFVAVDGIDLEVRAGEFVSLLGPSGCGKTTTLRMIAGFLEPSDGSIEMDGKVLSSRRSSLPPESGRCR